MTPKGWDLVVASICLADLNRLFFLCAHSRCLLVVRRVECGAMRTNEREWNVVHVVVANKRESTSPMNLLLRLTAIILPLFAAAIAGHFFIILL